MPATPATTHAHGTAIRRRYRRQEVHVRPPRTAPVYHSVRTTTTNFSQRYPFRLLRDQRSSSSLTYSDWLADLGHQRRQLIRPDGQCATVRWDDVRCL